MLLGKFMVATRFPLVLFLVKFVDVVYCLSLLVFSHALTIFFLVLPSTAELILYKLKEMGKISQEDIMLAQTTPMKK